MPTTDDEALKHVRTAFEIASKNQLSQGAWQKICAQLRSLRQMYKEPADAKRGMAVNRLSAANPVAPSTQRNELAALIKKIKSVEKSWEKLSPDSRVLLAFQDASIDQSKQVSDRQVKSILKVPNDIPIFDNELARLRSTAELVQTKVSERITPGKRNRTSSYNRDMIIKELLPLYQQVTNRLAANSDPFKDCMAACITYILPAASEMDIDELVKRVLENHQKKEAAWRESVGLPPSPDLRKK